MESEVHDGASDYWVRRRRAKAAAAFAAFIAVVGLAGTGFAFASGGDRRPEGYAAFAPADDMLFDVLADPAEPGVAPRTDSIVTGTVVAIALSLPSADAAEALLAASQEAGLDASVDLAQRIATTSTNADGRPEGFISVGFLLEAGYAQALGMSSDGTFVLTYDPPIVQLPANPSPGADWSGEGLTSGFAPYSATASVLTSPEVLPPAGLVDDPESCLNVRTRLDQSIPDADGYVQEAVSVWCPGRHIVASRSSTGTALRVAAPGEIDWSAVTMPALQAQLPGAVLPSPVVSMQVRRAPVSSPSGLVVVNDQMGDLLSLTVPVDTSEQALARSTALWLQHPGGAVLGVGSDAEGVVVSTSARLIVALDHAGRLRWRHAVPDVASGSPLLSEDAVVVALVDGSVRGLDRESGQVLWTQRLSDVITQSPVRVGDAVVVADNAGYVVAIGAQGEVAWTGSLDPVSGPLSRIGTSHALIPHGDGVLTLIDGAGAQMWSATGIEGAVNSIAALWGDVVAVPTRSGLLGLDFATGDTRWEIPDLTSANLGGERLVADGGRVVRVKEDGSVEPVIDVREADGGEPLDMFIARMGDQWVAVQSSGAMTYLEEAR